MSRDSYPASLNPFGGSSGSRGPGSELDHPGGSLYESAATYHSDDEDLPPPPADWLAPVFTPSQPASTQHRPTPTVILPPFRVQCPAAWFAQCADLFWMRGIHDQRDQFALCYAMLQNDQLSQVDDIAEMTPPLPDAFNRMRDRLVASHSLDEYQRLDQLLALPALGRQRPSALLAQMRQLCPQGEEGTKFFSAAFLQRLPPQLRLHLAEDRHSPMQALAARADTLIAHHSFGSVAAVSVPNAGEDQDPLVAAVRDAKPQDWRSGKGRGNKGKGDKPKPGGGGKRQPWELLGICRTHYKYGEECFSCAEPNTCKWSTGN
jgi:hypothetical protein